MKQVFLVFEYFLAIDGGSVQLVQIKDNGVVEVRLLVSVLDGRSVINDIGSIQYSKRIKVI